MHSDQVQCSPTTQNTQHRSVDTCCQCQCSALQDTHRRIQAWTAARNDTTSIVSGHCRRTLLPHTERHTRCIAARPCPSTLPSHMCSPIQAHRYIPPPLRQHTWSCTRGRPSGCSSRTVGNWPRTPDCQYQEAACTVGTPIGRCWVPCSLLHSVHCIHTGIEDGSLCKCPLPTRPPHTFEVGTL